MKYLLLCLILSGCAPRYSVPVVLPQELQPSFRSSSGSSVSPQGGTDSDWYVGEREDGSVGPKKIWRRY
jgi:hypothetical protein